MAEASTVAYLSKCISQKRSIYSNRTVSFVFVLLELLIVLLEYIDLFVITILEFILLHKFLPIMLALCSMFSDIYYAHNYASIIGGSLCTCLFLPYLVFMYSILVCNLHMDEFHISMNIINYSVVLLILLYRYML